MKKIIRIKSFVLLVLNPCTLWAQVMTGALINACGTEGSNEFLFFKNTGSAFNVTASTIDIRYGTSANPTVGYTNTLETAGNAAYINSLNALLPNTCDFTFENAPVNSTIPADTNFIVTRFSADNIIDYSAWCQKGNNPKIYVVFSNDAQWTTSGEFANTGTTNRYFQTIINGNTMNYEYLPETTAANPAGWSSDANGNFVSWPLGGGAANQYGNYSNCTPPTNNPMPVQVFDFEANYFQFNINKLSWKAVNATNFARFEVQKSADAKTFETIGIVLPYQNEKNASSHHFLDKNEGNSTVYYRLKKVDVDGKLDFSKIISLTHHLEDELLVYPNPTYDEVKISGLKLEDVESIWLSNGYGKQLKKFEIKNTLKLSEIPTSVVWLNIRMKNGVPLSKRLVKL
jgi:hypothetical protein